MRAFVKAVGALGLILVAACSETTVAPSTNQSLGSETYPGYSRQLTVMSRNMYVGTDLDAVMAALTNGDAGDDFPAMLAAIQTLKATDYDLRVSALANEIARNRPAVVGLQEVTRIDVDLTPYGVSEVIHGDFLADLKNEFALRGLPYVVGSQVQNWVAAPLAGVSLVDFDVVLVDPSRVTVGATFSRTFPRNIGQLIPGVNQIRGWTGVEATYEGQPYAFVTTHLESGPAFAQLRAEQAADLMKAMANRPHVILMGDFNDQAASPMYQQVTKNGFRDVWNSLRGDAGYTCCMLPDLANERPRLTERIDYVFAKGLDFPEVGLVGDIILTGIERRDRFAGPTHMIWPSDHAGVVARLRLPFMTIDTH